MKRISKLLSAFALVFCLALTGCNKSGEVATQTNDNKTVVYTLIGIQDTKYSIAGAVQNNMMGKHTFYYETGSDGKTLKKLVYIWTIEPDITRHILEVNQPDATSETSMQNLYNYIDNEMYGDYALLACSDSTGTKVPDYMTLIRGKSENENKSTLTVVIDLTDDSINLKSKNVQYSALEDFISPRLYSKKKHKYIITEKRLKKYVNDTSEDNQAYLEISEPILTEGKWKVEKKSVKTSELKSKEIAKKVKMKKKAMKKAAKSSSESSSDESSIDESSEESSESTTDETTSEISEEETTDTSSNG